MLASGRKGAEGAGLGFSLWQGRGAGVGEVTVNALIISTEFNFTQIQTLPLSLRAPASNPQHRIRAAEALVLTHFSENAYGVGV